MSRGALLISAGFLACGLYAPALADQQGASTGGVAGAATLVGALGGATIVDEITGPPYDYPPPYSASRHYAYPRYHHYAYSRYHHYAYSPYHRHHGLEPYSYYNPEK
jgi:hypothetical protein